MSDARFDTPDRRPDTVALLIEEANRLLGGSSGRDDVDRFIGELQALSPRGLIQFDAQSRSWDSGVSWSVIARLRRPLWRTGRLALWNVLGLVSADGHMRQRAVEAVEFTPLTARLLALRATDWVEQVRDAAIARLRECPPSCLIEALALADQLTASRLRGRPLDELLDARLAGEDLRAATRDPDRRARRARRAAWRRLSARGEVEAAELRDIAATDEDPVVRSFAAAALETLPDEARRTLAQVLVVDPVGRVAIPALAALVRLDGAGPIRRALTGPSAGVRRSARNWAAIREVDARAVYRRRLTTDPRDRVALGGLAEIGDARDVELFREMLTDDRPRLRAAALRALAPLDRTAARAAAVGALQVEASGREGRAAGDVLRKGPLSAAELDILTALAQDRSKGEGSRFRALALLRRYRWRHLAAVLEARDFEEVEAVRARLDQAVGVWIASSGSIGRGPEPDVGIAIERLLDTLAPERRRAIEFVLRTSRALPSRP